MRRSLGLRGVAVDICFRCCSSCSMIAANVPSVMREGLVVDFSLDEAGFGGLSASFYYPWYILLQIPAGILVSRRRAVGSDRRCAVCTVASFLFAMSHTTNVAELTPDSYGWVCAHRGVHADACGAMVSYATVPDVGCVDRGVRHGRRGAGAGGSPFIVDQAGWRAGMISCGGSLPQCFSIVVVVEVGILSVMR